MVNSSVARFCRCKLSIWIQKLSNASFGVQAHKAPTNKRILPDLRLFDQENKEYIQNKIVLFTRMKRRNVFLNNRILRLKIRISHAN